MQGNINFCWAKKKNYKCVKVSWTVLVPPLWNFFLSEDRLLSVLMSKLVKKCQQKEQFVIDLVMLIFINFTIISLIFFQSLFIFLDISWYLSLPCSLFMFFSQVILYTYFLLHLSIFIYDFHNNFLLYLILFLCFFDNKLYNSFLYIRRNLY